MKPSTTSFVDDEHVTLRKPTIKEDRPAVVEHPVVVEEVQEEKQGPPKPLAAAGLSLEIPEIDEDGKGRQTASMMRSDDRSSTLEQNGADK